jgi:ATP-dependent protease ClpP protease subunit
MENFRYINNYIVGKKTAKMSLNRPIGGENGQSINGADFAREMDYLAEAGVEEVVIEINSPGGNIKEGFSIFAAIKDAPFRTVTKVIGIAASMAGIISQAGDYRIIKDYALFHAHGPQVPKGKEVEADLLNKMLESLKTMIRAKTNLTDEQVNNLLGKETVLTASEALQMGLFDEIEETKGVKPELLISNNVEALYEMANNFITKNDEMKNLNDFLQLENATEEQIIAKVTEIKAEAAKVEELNNELTAKATEIESLTNELNEVKEANKALKLQTATDVVENAIKAGKIKEDSRESWITQAVNDLEVTRSLLLSFAGETKAVRLTNALNTESKREEKESRKDWDFQKWSQEDPKGLEQLKADAPEEFEAMLNAYIEK